MESEPPYQYVGGNPINFMDPSGFSPTREEVGDRYVYSCNCGWIDWDHAGVREVGLMEEIDNVQFHPDRQLQGMWGWASLTEPFIWSGEAGGYSTTNGEIFVFKNLSRIDKLRVALGIFISKENLFEAHQGGEFFLSRALVRALRQEFPDQLGAPSSFSEEDLISNLIGFHRGLRQHTLGWSEDTSRSYFERSCGVVGLHLLQTGRRSEFETKQKEIFDQYGPFQNVYVWGKPRLGSWQGSVEVDCNSEECKNPRVPVDLLWLDPAPPYPYQSTKSTWTWVSAQANLFGLSIDFSSNNLNQRPLNWLN